MSLKETHRDGKYGFEDESGLEVIPCKYDIVGEFKDGCLIWVTSNDRIGLYNKLGHEITPCVYSGMDFLCGFREGLLAVRKKDRWGYIDMSGREVIPCQYEDAFAYCEGLARVMRNNCFGFIDKTGVEVIPCEYYEAGVFSEGLAWVEKEGKCGYIDKTGKVVIPFVFYKAFGFSGGKARVITVDPEIVDTWSYSYIDKNGKVLNL